MNPTLHFDRCQFDGKFAQPVSKETRLSHADYKTMRTYVHNSRPSVKSIPAWTLNDAEVRRVIAARLARLISAPIPNTLEELRVLDDKVVASFEKVESEEIRKSAALARRAGGLPAYWVAVIYKTFRLGRNSVEVAADLGATPWDIRQTIWRLKETAKKLDAGTYGRRLNMQDVHLSEEDEKQLVQLYQRGTRFSELIRRYKTNHYRARKALERAGVLIMSPRQRGIVQLYQQGSRFCDIRRRYKVSGFYVRTILKRAGVWISRRNVRFPEEEMEYVRLYQEGFRLGDLQRRYKRSGYYIREALKRANVWTISAHGARCRAARERAKLRKC